MINWWLAEISRVITDPCFCLWGKAFSIGGQCHYIYLPMITESVWKIGIPLSWSNLFHNISFVRWRSKRRKVSKLWHLEETTNMATLHNPLPCVSICSYPLLKDLLNRNSSKFSFINHSSMIAYPTSSCFAFNNCEIMS